MTDGGEDFNLGHVVGDAGADGSTLWYTSTAPTYANSKYTFTISNLSGKSGLEVAVNDIIFYSTYYYVVSAVNSTTVDCSTRVNIKGSDASVTIQTSWGTTTSDSKVPSEKLTKTALDGKSNTGHTHTKSEVTDFPTLSTVATSGSYNDLSNKPTIPSASSTTPSADVSGGSVGTGTTWAKADHQHPLSTAYATSGHTHGNLQSDGSVGTSSNASKNVVTDSNGKITTEAKPTIPSKISDLQNDSNFIETSSTAGLVKNDGTIDTTTYLSSLPSHTHGQVTNDGKITSTAVTVASGDNIVITDASDSSKVKRVANILADHVKDGTAHSNIGSSANDSQATINTDIDTALGNKQATLVSGSNIKTVNNESLLGSGNITIQGGSTVDIVTSWNSTTSDSKVPSEKLTKTSLDDKISKSNTSGLVKNDGTIDTNSYITSSSLPTKTSDLTNDGSSSSDSLVYVETSATSGLLKNDGTVDTSTYLTEMKIGTTSGLPVKTGSSGALTVGSFGSTSGTFAEGNHSHNQITSDGKITSTAVTVASGDNIVITDASDSSKIKRVANLLTDHVKDSAAHTNIGSSASATQSTINSSIDTALSNKISKSSTTGLVKNDGSIDTSSYITSSSLPTKTSDLTNDGSSSSDSLVYVETSATSGLLKNDGTVDTTSYLSSLPSHNHDDRYYTESEMDTALSGKQATLVSGTNIKTINNTSLLGSGNITIQGGGGSTGDYYFTLDSFFDPNQWTGSPTISNGTITMSSDASFPLRLPPNCTLTFDLTLTNQNGEQVTILTETPDTSWADVFDFTITATNNSGTLVSEATGDEFILSNISSLTGLSIQVTSGSTATISNVVYDDGQGGGGSVDIVTSWSATTSNSKVPSEKLAKDSLDLKSDSTHTHGNLSSDGKISTTSSATMLYFTGVDASANTLYKSNKLSSDVIIDGTAHSNIGSSANDSQSTINAKIDTLIGQAISYINQ